MCFRRVLPRISSSAKNATHVKTSCIYYDLEEITPDDLNRARSCAPGAREFIARGAAWPDNVGGPLPSEVPNPREVGYHEELMKWIDRLFQALEQAEPDSALCHWNGVSLLEILRYRFLFDFAETEQRLRAVSEISKCGATRIIWVSPRRGADGMAAWAAREKSVELECLPAAHAANGRHPVLQLARSMARSAFDRLTNRISGMMNRAPKTPVAARGPIVFVEFYPSNVSVLVPVAHFLRDAYGLDVVWLAARKPVKKALEQLGVSSLGIRQLAPVAHCRGKGVTSTKRRELLSVLDRLPGELFFGTGNVSGRSYLLPGIYNQLVSLLNEAGFWLDALSEAFEHLRPTCTVSTSYSSIVGRAAAYAGQRQGARSAYVQHGLFPDCDYLTHICSDLLLLWGDANRRTMVRNGFTDERLKVVGPTIYDNLMQRCRTKSQNSFPKPGEPIRVAYLASRTAGSAVNYATAKHCLLTIVEAVSKVPNAHLTVKVHPGDKTGMVEGLLEAFPNVSVVLEESSQDVICQCDVAIVVSSTTGLEACMAEKTLIALEIQGVPDYGTYQEYGAAIQFTLGQPEAAQALADTIQSLASSRGKLDQLAGGRLRLVDDLLNGGTGNAIELTAAAIADLATGRTAMPRQINAVE
jgi:hypothetical protein